MLVLIVLVLAVYFDVQAQRQQFNVFYPLQPSPQLVAALPVAGVSNSGQIRVVSDSTTITAEGQTCAGSGAITALAFSNGSAWVCF